MYKGDKLNIVDVFILDIELLELIELYIENWVGNIEIIMRFGYFKIVVII